MNNTRVAASRFCNALIFIAVTFLLTNTAHAITQYVSVTVLSTNDIYSRYLGTAINSQLGSSWWTTGQYTCDPVIGSGSVGSTYSCAVSSTTGFSTAQVGISSGGGYVWGLRVTWPDGIMYDCYNLNNTQRCPAYIGLTPTFEVIASSSTTNVNSGQQVSMSAQVTGGMAPFSYQWYTNTSTTLTPVAGATSSTFSFIASYNASRGNPNIYYYKVRVSDSAGRSLLSLPIQVAINPSATTTTSTTTTTTYSTTAPSPIVSCGVFNRLYIGWQLACSPFTVSLSDIAAPNSTGISKAALSLYYNGYLVQQLAISPGSTQVVSYAGFSTSISVNRTFTGLYAYQKWAEVSLTSSAGPTPTASISLSPTSGPAGTSLSVAGSNFKYPASITISFGGSAIAYTGTNSAGAFGTYFSVPTGYTGAVTVSATDGTNTAYATYNVVQSTSTTTVSTTTTPQPQVGCSTLFTVYTGGSVICQSWTAQVVSIGSPNSAGVSPAAINVYYNGVLTNQSTLWPASSAIYSVNGQSLSLSVNQIFAGLYASQSWASISLTPGVAVPPAPQLILPPLATDLYPNGIMILPLGGSTSIWAQTSIGNIGIINQQALQNAGIALTIVPQSYSGSGLYAWTIYINVKNNAQPGTYNLTFRTLNAVTSANTIKNFTIKVNSTSVLNPPIQIVTNPVTLYPSQSVTDYVKTAYGSIGASAASAYGGIAAPASGVNITLGNPQVKPYGWLWPLIVSASASAKPGAYTFQLQSQNSSPTPAFYNSNLNVNIINRTTSSTANVTIWAYDNQDPYSRYWDVWVNTFPGAYSGSANAYTNASTYTRILTSNGRAQNITFVKPSSYNNVIYFLVTQSGGKAYGNYSGVFELSVGGVLYNITSFTGVDVYHALRVGLAGNRIVNYSVVPLPPFSTSRVLHPRISLSQSSLTLYPGQRGSIFAYTFPGGIGGYSSPAHGINITVNTYAVSNLTTLYTGTQVYLNTTWLINVTAASYVQPGVYNLSLYTWNDSNVFARTPLQIIIQPATGQRVLVSTNPLFIVAGSTGSDEIYTTFGNMGLSSSNYYGTMQEHGHGYSNGLWNWTVVFNDSISPVPGTYAIRIFDGSTGIVYGNLTLVVVSKPTTSTTVTTTIPTSLFTTTVPQYNYTTFTLTLRPGWNLFSIPVAYVTNSSSGTCTTSTFTSPIWQLVDGQYTRAVFLTGGIGYWVKAGSACTATFTGPALTSSQLPTLSNGWNIVGGFNYPTPIANITGTCHVTKGPLGYDTTTNSYYNATTLLPGAGYFIRVDSGCQLGAGGPPPPPK